MISCILKTHDFRGDHSTDISLAFEVKENETVRELCDRVLKYSYREHIELRLVLPADDNKEEVIACSQI